MKKFILSLLTLVAALSLVSCGSSSSVHKDLNGDHKKMQTPLNVGDDCIAVLASGNFIQGTTKWFRWGKYYL